MKLILGQVRLKKFSFAPTGLGKELGYCPAGARNRKKHPLDLFFNNPSIKPGSAPDPKKSLWTIDLWFRLQNQVNLRFSKQKQYLEGVTTPSPLSTNVTFSSGFISYSITYHKFLSVIFDCLLL